MVDSRTKGSTADQRASTEAVKAGGRRVNGSGMVDPVKSEATKEPIQRADGTVSKPTVDGQEVEGMWLHFIGGPVHLISPGDGTFEFERLYYTDGKYQAKAGYDGRIGSEIILKASLSHDRLVIETSRYQVQVPVSRVSGNWLSPGKHLPDKAKIASF